MSDELAALDAAARQYRETEAAHKRAAAAAMRAALDALAAGEPPTVVAEHSPFTAAYIRQHARAAGIEPAKPGPKPDAGRGRRGDTR